MDIRNFFKPSGGNKTKKKKSSAPSSNSESKKKSSKSTNKKRNIKDEEDENEDGLKNESVTEVGKTTSKSSKEKSNKKRRVVNIEDDEKSDITVEDVVKQKEKKSKTSKKISTPSSTSKNDNSKKKRVEVSVDDFFSGSAETDPVKKKKQKKKRKAIIESDDDDDYNDDDFKAGSEGESDHEMMDVDDGEDDFIAPKKKSKNKRKIESPIKKGEEDIDEDKTSSSAKKKKPAPRKKTTTASPKKPAKKKPKKEKFLVKPCEPYPQHPFTISDEASSNCLEGITFVFTGVLSNLSREEAEDMCKEYGGRVVKAVSGRVNYLVCGSKLEDERDYTEGSKYKKAIELGPTSITVLTSQEEFYGVIQLLREKNLKEQPQPAQEEKKNEKEGKKETTTKPVVNPYAAKPANPYAANKPVNPYAKPVNPYAKTSTSTSMKNPYASSTSTKLNRSTATTTTTKSGGPSGGRAQANDPNALWADKYAPSSSKFILGNGETVRKLSDWLSRWENTFVNVSKGKKKGFGGRTYKAALLSGPPGIGKTTTAFLVATEAGREVLELNASDARSKKTLSQTLGDVTGSQVLNFGSNKKSASNNKKRCIIMDEVDGMGAGDRSGMSELINMIKKSKVPIICICNDRQSQKVKSLAGHCLDLRFKRPVKSMIARRTVEVGRLEGMQIEQNAAEAIVESCGNDIRQVMNCIQMWASKNKDQKQTMRYKDVKERLSSIDKDEILRVSMFEATVKIVEGPKGVGMGENLDLKKAKDSLYKRCDAFFTDYNLMGLMTHQNYPKVMVSQFSKTKASGDSDAEAAVMDRLHDATLSMSDYALTENSLRAGQAWSLLPLCSILCVKTGFHAAGEGGAFYGGYPEFSSWLGKNSSKGKKTRILQELNHHMNYKVSSDKSELRLRYLPILKQRFAELFQEASEDKSKFSEIIELMDEYGLDRDDLFEGMDEFGFPESSKQEQKEFKFASLDSKTKAAFTREYNKGSHKSQALAEKQIASKVGKKRKTKSDDDVMMGDDDEDGGVESDDEKDIDDDIEAIQNMFKSKKKKGSTAKGGTKGKRTTKKSKK